VVHFDGAGIKCVGAGIKCVGAGIKCVGAGIKCVGAGIKCVGGISHCWQARYMHFVVYKVLLNPCNTVL